MMTNENTPITVYPLFVLWTHLDINECIDIKIVDVEKRHIASLSKNNVFGANIITENEW